MYLNDIRNSSLQVWSASANGAHDPPTHYAWNQLDKWGTGPECTTILCRANGQAIAWMTSAPVSYTISNGCCDMVCFVLSVSHCPFFL